MTPETVDTFTFSGFICDDGDVYLKASDLTAMFRSSIAYYTDLFTALEDVDGEDRDSGISLVAAIQVLEQESDAIDVACMDFLTTEPTSPD